MRKYLIITGYRETDETRIPIFSSIELLTKGDEEALYLGELYFERFELCELVDHIPDELSSFMGYESNPSYNLN